MVPDQPPGVATWLNDLAQRSKLTKMSSAVVRALTAHPRLASYGSIREVAEKASASIGTVTRTSQKLGYSGWPELQRELRTIYISSLSAYEISEQRRQGDGSPAYATLVRDRDNLSTFIRGADLDRIARVASAIAEHRRVFVVAAGSYNGVGLILAHSSSLLGYDVRLLAEEASLINWVTQAEPTDLVIAISFWRLYKTTYDVIQTCNDNDVPVVLITENVTREIEGRCFETLHVPSESIGFSPSMTTVTSVINSIVAELAALDPKRTERQFEHAEQSWKKFGLLHEY